MMRVFIGEEAADMDLLG